MGGIDPFGDIMGTSAGPAGEEEKYLFKGKFSFTFISQQHTCGDTNTALQMLAVSPSQVVNDHKYDSDGFSGAELRWVDGAQTGIRPPTKAQKPRDSNRISRLEMMLTFPLSAAVSPSLLESLPLSPLPLPSDGGLWLVKSLGRHWDSWRLTWPLSKSQTHRTSPPSNQQTL